MRRTAEIAATTVFSAMAVALTLAKLTVPYPLLPYLKFDLSEVPVTVALFLLGPPPGLLSTVIYWLVLTLRAGDVLGPAMKFAAVASMMVGFALGAFLCRRLGRGRTAMIIVGLLLGAVARVLVMSLLNFVILTLVAPHYLEFATPLLASLGLPVGTRLGALLWIIILTAIYNLLHTLLAVLPAYVIAEAALRRVPGLLGESWLAEK
ncbi:MAG: hypothetical protein AYL28_002110 [Candidatus Bathyarchaeota archaeon B23]|nr:MAG: hypothetical protein AYL28_002110 [Candidatus Bathyarchaeota archaeon B23]